MDLKSASFYVVVIWILSSCSGKSSKRKKGGSVNDPLISRYPEPLPERIVNKVLNSTFWTIFVFVLFISLGTLVLYGIDYLFPRETCSNFKGGCGEGKIMIKNKANSKCSDCKKKCCKFMYCQDHTCSQGYESLGSDKKKLSCKNPNDCNEKCCKVTTTQDSSENEE